MAVKFSCSRDSFDLRQERLVRCFGISVYVITLELSASPGLGEIMHHPTPSRLEMAARGNESLHLHHPIICSHVQYQTLHIKRW